MHALTFHVDGDTGLPSTQTHALRCFCFQRQGELPRDQDRGASHALDLVHTAALLMCQPPKTNVM